MGFFCTHCHPGIALYLRDKLGLKRFVETGTCHGESAEWAADKFDEVITIEASATYYQEAAQRLAVRPNVRVIQGHSPETLSSLLAERNDIGTLFWLDAHWCGDAAFKGELECPLANELWVISRLFKDTKVKHAIMIDDARLFTAPPPAPHKAGQWPDLKQIADNVGDGMDMRIQDDVIMIAPSGSMNAYWGRTS